MARKGSEAKFKLYLKILLKNEENIGSLKLI